MTPLAVIDLALSLNVQLCMIVLMCSAHAAVLPATVTLFANSSVYWTTKCIS